ncbi:MAG: hypothetical protein HLUCCO17_17085 [Saliniramus fredricksonii]|uniref:Uncharacterized protein n=1 Tax=Saliniramus fredricksonii TaxID=1653334 RepID=A0A0P7XWA2_9HYPH|nr:MAG: hypothetical protein HLUCCO17_17085 [Saliniramus fredricksonii]
MMRQTMTWGARPDSVRSERALRDEGALIAQIEPFALFYRDTVEAIRAWQAGEPVRVLAAP